MASTEFLLERNLRTKGIVARQAVDSSVAIRLRYIGTGTVTSVTTTTAVDITMITSDGGTDTYDFATYSTVGLLVDKINADGIFEAKVLDTLRSKATASQFIDGAITSGTFYGSTVWDVLLDSDACDYLAYRLTFWRGFDKDLRAKSHRIHLKELKYLINLSGATASSISSYKTNYTSSSPKEEQLLFTQQTVDNVATTTTFMSGKNQLSAGNGEDLVIIIPDNDDLTDTAAYIQVVGAIE